MNRKMKTLGLALVAVLAMTVVMASAAQAQFTSSADDTTISGSQVDAHRCAAGTGVGAISCSTATFAGSQSGRSAAQIALTPTYANCKDSLARTLDISDDTVVVVLLAEPTKAS